VQAGDLAFQAAPSFCPVAVELAKKGVPIFFGPIGRVGDEVFPLLARSFAKGLCMYVEFK
jgi:hypothetical protein